MALAGALKVVPDEPGVSHRVFNTLAENMIVVDMIAQNVGSAGKASIGFTVLGNELPGFFPLSNAKVQLKDDVAQTFVNWRAECKSTIRNSYQILSRGTPNLEKINFIGHRYLIDQLLAQGALARGASIGFISSAAGLGWESNLDLWLELMPITAWIDGSQIYGSDAATAAFLLDSTRAAYSLSGAVEDDHDVERLCRAR